METDSTRRVTERPRLAPDRAAGLLGALAILAATLLIYTPAMRGEFLWDDDSHLTENPHMTAEGGLQELWTSGSFYYPLTSTTFWVARRIWGLNPVPYHHINIFLHAFNAILLWRLLRRLRVGGAWLAGAIFALHPVCVQSVAWITELKNMQSGFFYLLALYCWARREDAAARGWEWGWQALSLTAFILAVLSKTSTVMLPVALVLIHFWRQGPSLAPSESSGAVEQPGAELWCRHPACISFKKLFSAGWIPFFAVSLLAGALTVTLHRRHVADVSQFSETLAERLIIAGRAVWFYLGKLFWPRDLAFVYPRWTVDPGRFMEWLPLIGAIVLAAALALIQWRWWRGRGALLVYIYYVASLFPVLGFFRMYYTRYSYVADHWQYLAAMGAVAWASASACGIYDRVVARPLFSDSRAARALGLLAPMALLAALGFLSWRQARIYRDNKTLWLDTISKNPTSAIAWNNLGIDYTRKGDFVRAASAFHQGVIYHSEDPELLANLGGALTPLRRFGEAVNFLEKANRLGPGDPQTLRNLALALDGAGRRKEALAALRQGVALHPGDPALRKSLDEMTQSPTAP